MKTLGCEKNIYKLIEFLYIPNKNKLRIIHKTNFILNSPEFAYKIFIVLIIYFATIYNQACFAQPTIQVSITVAEQKADSLKKNRFFNDAIIERLSIYKIDSTYNPNIFQLAALYSLTRKMDSSFYFLYIAVKGDSSIRFLSNADFYFICKNFQWKNICSDQIIKYELANGPIKRPDLALKLLDMKMKDQAYYSLIDYSNSKEATRFWEIKDSLNNINLLLLDSIIKKSGWPKKSDIGEYPAVAAFLVLQHSDLISQKNYLPYLKKAVRQHEADKKDLALLIDRIKLRENKKQIYGSQISYDNETNKSYFDYSKLRNPYNINNRRKKMGLGPIEDYVKIWNITWDYKQK
ncbi:MAG: hypothetical protein Q7U54_03875 [Bacteroidales bacterium]|nr:hypothetical protein [Bacteroidales bacterium]